MTSMCHFNYIFSIVFNFQFTANLFVELVRFLFQVPGVKIFFSCTLCQHPLEKLLDANGKEGTHDNPTVKEFQLNTRALRVVNSFYRPVVKGNCRGDMKVIDKENVDTTLDLPRRSTKRKKRKYSICM